MNFRAFFASNESFGSRRCRCCRGADAITGRVPGSRHLVQEDLELEGRVEKPILLVLACLVDDLFVVSDGVGGVTMREVCAKGEK